jgi:N-acetylmuramoyl-L-alanine amidase
MKLELLVIHCTATPEDRKVTKEDIIRWHTSSKEDGGRGWKQVGYSDMIALNGELINLVPYNDDDIIDPWEITNGVKGINGRARHIVYVGGMDKKGKVAKDTRTIEQLATMIDYIDDILEKHPDIKIAGHNQFADKICPSFSVPQWLRWLGIPKQNIYAGSNIS